MKTIVNSMREKCTDDFMFSHLFIDECLIMERFFPNPNEMRKYGARKKVWMRQNCTESFSRATQIDNILQCYVQCTFCVLVKIKTWHFFETVTMEC